ncbi:hypothetical protein DH2020_034840 [Rehmannia glutinosa]|uniref:Uncharacterized protein n=1 Tax=Rehmannia glutinosa TaxID=99300 RepID=A0ABR0VAF2_REHGL
MSPNWLATQVSSSQLDELLCVRSLCDDPPIFDEKSDDTTPEIGYEESPPIFDEEGDDAISTDGKFSVILLSFLRILEMAEEEYGLTVHGPLRVPCEKELMESILCLLRKNPNEDVEKAFLSIAMCRVFCPRDSSEWKPRMPLVEFSCMEPPTGR